MDYQLYLVLLRYLHLYSYVKNTEATVAANQNKFSTFHLNNAEEIQKSDTLNANLFHSSQSSIPPSLSSEPTTTPYMVTVPYESLDLQCKMMATNFAYQNDLCMATDPASYLESATAVYSCLNRCGQAVAYSADGVRECSSDPACVAYQDCCRDMSIVCPQAYRDGGKVYRHLVHVHSTQCLSSVLQLTKCSRMIANIREKVWRMPSSPPKKELIQYKVPMPSLTLEQLSEPFIWFSTVDLSLGVIFNKPGTFNSCSGSATSMPYLVPKITTMDCREYFNTGVVEYFGTRINRNRFRNILGYFGTIPIYPPPSGRIFRNRQDISEPPPSLWDAQYLTLHNE